MCYFGDELGHSQELTLAADDTLIFLLSSFEENEA